MRKLLDHLAARVSLGCAMGVTTCLAAIGQTAPAVVHAWQPPGLLSRSNFVGVADGMVDMLDTSGLAYASMLLGAADRTLSSRPVAPSLKPSFGAERHATTTPCPQGGFVKLAMLDADESGDISVRDSFTLAFHACRIGRETIEGGSDFIVTAHRFEGPNEITQLLFHFRGLGTSSRKWTGAASATLRSDLLRGTESYEIGYRDLVVDTPGHRMRWNFTLGSVQPPIGSFLVTVRGRLQFDDMALRLEQDEPFTVEQGPYPVAGLLSAIDRRGAHVELEAGRRRFTYRFYTAANRGVVPDASSFSASHPAPRPGAP